LDTENYDLVKTLRLMYARSWVIIASSLAGLLISFAVTILFIPKLYSSDVLLYVGQKEGGSLTTGDLTLFSQLVNDYQVMIKSRLATQQIASQLQLPPDQADALGRQISISSKSNTRHITITVVNQNPQMAAAIANTTASIFSTTVVDRIGTISAQVIDEAIVPSEPASPDGRKNSIFGLLLGLCLSTAILAIISYLDTTVRTAEEAQMMTSYPLLGSIPSFYGKSGRISRVRRA
jgi:capsular polysaccharide biosynthesis protein